jgi:FkbM family methyltransferase
MDAKLEMYLPPRGVFVEAGANDGVQQSNTYYLERIRHWTGLLIEPVPDMAKRARKHRSSPVVNAALVAAGYQEPTIQIQASGLTSMVPGSRDDHHPELGSDQLTVDVPARTLSSLLDEHEIRPDFLSLDVEGYEPDVLQGLDFDRHAPTWILMEILGDPEAERLLDRYERVAQLSPHDFLYRLRRPIRTPE